MRDYCRGMSRQPPPLPDTAEGHEERLRRADARIRRVLSARLAQDPVVLKMGTRITVRVSGPEAGLTFVNVDVDPADLEHLTTLIRPCTLAREEVQAEKVTATLARFAVTQEHELYVDQLTGLRQMTGASRLYLSKWDGRTGEEVIPSWTSDSVVADRYTYSSLVHADDASALLDHVDVENQLWALAGFAGDWVAYLSHVQGVAHAIRPDLVPELTAWAGTPWSVFERHGVPFTRGGPPPSP